MENLRIYLKEVLRNETFNIAKSEKHDEYQYRLSSMVYTCSDKKSATCLNKSSASHTGTAINCNSDSENQQLAEELHEKVLGHLEQCIQHLRGTFVVHI